MTKSKQFSQPQAFQAGFSKNSSSLSGDSEAKAQFSLRPDLSLLFRHITTLDQESGNGSGWLWERPGHTGHRRGPLPLGYPPRGAGTLGPAR